MPFFVFLAAISPDIIRLLYGPAWAGAAPIMATLFLAMPAYVTWGMSTPVLWNTGRARQEVLLQLPLVPVAVAGYYAVASHGLLAGAMVAAVVMGMRGLVMGTAAFRILKLPTRNFFGWLGRGLIVTIVVVGPGAIFIWFAPQSWHPLARLLLDGALTITAAASILLYPKMIGNEASSMLVRFVPAMASRLKIRNHV
jgi:O-antigen/teichoic acid export membrane protein